MMKKCSNCDAEFQGVGRVRLCDKCGDLRKRQNARLVAKFADPIYTCVIDGCKDEATETTLCKRHSRQLIKKTDEKCKHPKCRQNAEVDSYCLKHINDKSIKVEKEKQVKSEVVDDLHVLPEFMRYNACVDTTMGNERCHSEYPCNNPIYQDGLCSVHYRLKSGMKLAPLDKPYVANQTNPSVRDFNTPVLGICSTRKCNKVATHGKLCLSCYTKQVDNRNKLISKKLKHMRVGH